MKLPLQQFLFIVSFGVTVKAKNSGVKIIPLTPTKDPWLIPEKGILVTEHIPVSFAVRENNSTVVKFEAVPNVMGEVVQQLNTGKYRKASVENINNPHNYPIPNPTVPPSILGQRPKILYPKILVVVAHDLYQKLGSDLLEVIPYLLAFWNGVDMMYRSFENPKIRLNIAGIIIETEYGVFDYLEDHPGQKGAVNGLALQKAGSFWYKYKNEAVSGNYDTVLALTTRPICSNDIPCQWRMVGEAILNSMAVEDPMKKETHKVIIVTDRGEFSGIPSAAHELGHAFGMQHDNDRMFKSKKNLKDFPSCRRVHRGHIMNSDGGTKPYNLRWSQCSLEQLENFIKTKNLTSLYYPPAAGEIHIPRLLPGKLINSNDFCQRHHFDESCDSSFRTCGQIRCRWFDEPFNCLRSGSFAPDGTPCDTDGPHGMCMFGKCVSEAAFT